MSTRKSDIRTRGCWLLETEADIDANSNWRTSKAGIIVELSLRQFPIVTGNGFVYAECIGEV